MNTGMICDVEIRSAGLKNTVYVSYEPNDDDNDMEELFSYHSGEMIFIPSEFLNLTKEQALEKFHKKS